MSREYLCDFWIVPKTELSLEIPATMPLKRKYDVESKQRFWQIVDSTKTGEDTSDSGIFKLLLCVPIAWCKPPCVSINTKSACNLATLRSRALAALRAPWRRTWAGCWLWTGFWRRPEWFHAAVASCSSLLDKSVLVCWATCGFCYNLISQVRLYLSWYSSCLGLICDAAELIDGTLRKSSVHSKKCDLRWRILDYHSYRVFMRFKEHYCVPFSKVILVHSSGRLDCFDIPVL